MWVVPKSIPTFIALSLGAAPRFAALWLSRGRRPHTKVVDPSTGPGHSFGPEIESLQPYHVFSGERLGDQPDSIGSENPSTAR